MGRPVLIGRRRRPGPILAIAVDLADQDGLVDLGVAVGVSRMTGARAVGGEGRGAVTSANHWMT